MKADDKISLGLFDENLDVFWYEMGRNTYIGDKTSIEVPDNASKNQILSFRKGILDAARDMGDLEREDFYSETEFKAFDKEQPSRRK